MSYLIIILFFTGMISSNIINIEKRKEITGSKLYKKTLNKYNIDIKEEDFIIYNEIQNIKLSIIMIMLMILLSGIEYYKNIKISSEIVFILMFIVFLFDATVQGIRKKKYYENLK